MSPAPNVHSCSRVVRSHPVMRPPEAPETANRPRGSTVSAAMGLRGVVELSGSPVAARQKRTVPSSPPEMICAPATATALTGPTCPVSRSPMGSPDSTSHRRTVPSVWPVTTCRPSGVIASDRIELVTVTEPSQAGMSSNRVSTTSRL